MVRMLERLMREEQGHAQAGVGTLVGAIGAILLAIGAAGETDWLIWVGGVVLALGIIAAGLLHHTVVDYELYGRLEKLEGK